MNDFVLVRTSNGKCLRVLPNYVYWIFCCQACPRWMFGLCTPFLVQEPKEESSFAVAG